MVDDSNHPKKGINLANEDEYKVLEDMLRNEMKVKYGIDNFEQIMKTSVKTTTKSGFGSP